MSGPILRDKGGLISPVVRIAEIGGRRAVVKDYREKGFPTRTLLGPMLVHREARILRRLQGVPGIPRLIGVIDGAALAVEFVEGGTLGKFRPGDLPPETYSEMTDLVKRMHERGVVHLDLRQKKNVMITPDLHPVLIDFGASFAPAPGNPIARLLPWLQRVDASALLKVKQRNFPDLLTGADRAELERHRFWRRLWIFTPRGKYAR